MTTSGITQMELQLFGFPINSDPSLQILPDQKSLNKIQNNNVSDQQQIDISSVDESENNEFINDVSSANESENESENESDEYCPFKERQERNKKSKYMQNKEKSKQYNCEYCTYKTNVKYHLIRHCRTHTGERPWKCNECGKGFAQSSGLKTHSRIHTGESPYKCSHCEKRFKSKGGLMYHIQTHIGPLPFKCSKCKQRFRLISQRKIHFEVAHSMPYLESLY
eukprot:459410_1